MSTDIRWIQRFQNFKRANNLLLEAVDLDLATLSNLEKEGIAQRFEFTLELAWKTLKDKMEHDGLILDTISPRSVLKSAYHSKYIDNIDTWLDMVSDRNALSHTYDFSTLENIIAAVQTKYSPLINELFNLLDLALNE